jgi:ribulose-phosphate 3-epimerase
MLVSQSIWSVDQTRLAHEVDRFDPYVDSYHVDVMDSWFADELLYGPPMVSTLRGLTRRPIVVHLMIREPVRYAERLADAGADTVVVHAGACSDLSVTLQGLHRVGLATGCAIGLDDQLDLVVRHLDTLSTVLVMATPIGVKGQPFDSRALGTVRELIRRRTAGAPSILVDGGIRWTSVASIAEAGADGVVTGSITGDSDDLGAAMRRIVGFSHAARV